MTVYTETYLNLKPNSGVARAAASAGEDGQEQQHGAAVEQKHPQSNQNSDRWRKPASIRLLDPQGNLNGLNGSSPPVSPSPHSSFNQKALPSRLRATSVSSFRDASVSSFRDASSEANQRQQRLDFISFQDSKHSTSTFSLKESLPFERREVLELRHNLGTGMPVTSTPRRPRPKSLVPDFGSISKGMCVHTM